MRASQEHALLELFEHRTAYTVGGRTGSGAVNHSSGRWLVERGYARVNAHSELEITEAGDAAARARGAGEGR